MKDDSWRDRVERAIRKFRLSWLYFVAAVVLGGLAVLSDIIGRVDQGLFVYDWFFGEGAAPRNSEAPDGKTNKIHNTLATLSDEIDSIVETWPERHSHVEAMVPRVMAIAKELNPSSANEIQRSVDSGKTKLIAETIQQELKVMLDVLLIQVPTEGQ